MPADSCVYVGDGGDRELVAAAALGMRAIRTTEHTESDPTWTGPTVRTLAGLITELGRPAAAESVAVNQHPPATRPSATGVASHRGAG